MLSKKHYFFACGEEDLYLKSDVEINNHNVDSIAMNRIKQYFGNFIY